jgi:cell division transport system permease protein
MKVRGVIILRSLKQLFYLFLEGFRHFISFGWNTFSSLLIVAITLFILGSVISGFMIFEKVLIEMKGELQITVYLEEGMTGVRLEGMMEKIRRSEGVLQVDFRDKKEALNQFRQMMGDDSAELFEFLGDNPLPTSLQIRPASTTAAEEIIATIKKNMSLEITDIRYSGTVYQKMEKLLHGVRGFASIMIFVLILVSIGTTFTTVSLNIHNRSEEIEIMKLVGATRSFISMPYIFEAVILGFFSSLLSVMALFLFKGGLMSLLPLHLPMATEFLQGIPAVSTVLTLFFIGSALCITGTLFSLGRQFRR